MKGAEENRENAGDFTSMNWVSGDLVHELTKRVPKNEEREAEEGEEIDLRLGLSMNGRFGVDPTNKKLRRSSSASNVVVTDTSVGNGSNPQARGQASGSHGPLVKAWSMPSGTPERRHREVFQSARSMEKLKNVGVAKENENCSKGANGVSDPQVQLVKEATTQNPMIKGLTSRPFLPEPVAADEESPRNSLIDMPYVSTKGFGPNHKKIEGLLYGYKREEEVTIVCVCHGLFLSPAEFVKHGGGGSNVAYPLKHIVVSPFPHY